MPAFGSALLVNITRSLSCTIPSGRRGGLKMQKFDAIVIGTGQAGPPLAARLVEVGMKVAVIERKYWRRE
jgi:ribulose 1,5-bisphosphate synthetase/thiazole synthase